LSVRHHGVLGRWLRARLHWDTNRETVARTLRVVVGKDLGYLESALASSVVGLNVEEVTVLDESRKRSAGVDSLLQEVGRVPTHHEISMVPVSCKYRQDVTFKSCA